MGSVEEESHEHARERTGNRDSSDPRKCQETDSVEVDGLEGTVAESDTDGSTSDTHGGRDGEGVLRKDEDGQGGTHFHGTTSGWRVVGDLVTHDLHDVVSVGDETDRDGSGKDSELPDGNGGFSLSGGTGRPSTVDNSPRTDRVSDIVGTVSEGCGTGSEDLDERISVLDLVRVLFGVGVNSFHSVTFGSTRDTRLSGVDIVVETVKSTTSDHGGDSLGEDGQVVLFVNSTGAHRVGV